MVFMTAVVPRLLNSSQIHDPRYRELPERDWQEEIRKWFFLGTREGHWTWAAGNAAFGAAWFSGMALLSLWRYKDRSEDL